MTKLFLWNGFVFFVLALSFRQQEPQLARAFWVVFAVFFCVGMQQWRENNR